MMQISVKNTYLCIIINQHHKFSEIDWHDKAS